MLTDWVIHFYRVSFVFLLQENHKFLTNHVAAYLNVDMAVEGSLYFLLVG